MELQITQEGVVTVVTVRGEIDGRTAPQMQEQLLPLVAPGWRCLLDLGGVGYLSSAGLRTLLLLYRQITANEGRVALVNLPEMISDTMSITGFLDFFVAYDNCETALAALSAD